MDPGQVELRDGQCPVPSPQWAKLANIWEAYYPLAGLSSEKRQFFTTIEAAIPEFVNLLVNHRPESLRGESLGKALASADRAPGNLRDLYRAWQADPRQKLRVSPSLVFAVIGQARADGALTPEKESRLLSQVLTFWAMRNALDANEMRVAPPRVATVALAT